MFRDQASVFLSIAAHGFSMVESLPVPPHQNRPWLETALGPPGLWAFCPSAPCSNSLSRRSAHSATLGWRLHSWERVLLSPTDSLGSCTLRTRLYGQAKRTQLWASPRWVSAARGVEKGHFESCHGLCLSWSCQFPLLPMGAIIFQWVSVVEILPAGLFRN